jgi:hypothetical protein
MERYSNPCYSRIPCLCFPPRRADMLCGCEEERQNIVKEIDLLQLRMRRHNWFFNQSIVITNEPSTQRRVIFSYFYNSYYFNITDYFIYYIHLWTLAESELMIVGEYEEKITRSLNNKIPNILRTSLIIKFLIWVNSF